MGTPLYANTDPAPHPSLEFLVRNLDVDTVRSKRLMRQLLDEDEPGFLRHATRILQEHPETRGARHVLALLSERGLLLPLLCAPGTTKAHALELARGAMSAAPCTDIQLARGLADMLDAPETAETFGNVARLMEILAEISDAARLFPSMLRLMRHPNPHIRSKAVLMIGRQSRSAQWVRHRLSDSDPRIRANALEALWDVDTAEARELLETLLHDPNNRVAGNAMLGLYRLGYSPVIPEIIALSSHASALFRATAAWVMGETGDPRFSEALAVRLREPNPVVRKRAFAALRQIRAAAARCSQAPPCRLAARLVDPTPGPGRLLLAVAGQDEGPAPGLIPTQFVLSEDARLVTSYRVNRCVSPETISVVFLLPANGSLETWREAALAGLPWKRPGDLWACDFYEPEAALEAGADDDDLNFQANPENIQAEFARSPLRFECPDLWRAIRRLVDVEAGPLLGKRQIVVFRENESTGVPAEDLIAAIAAAQAMVQVISIGPDAILEDFCRSINGVFSCVATLGEAREAAIRACLFQLPQYEFSWQPVHPEARQLKIRIHSPVAAGETALSLPPRA